MICLRNQVLQSDRVFVSNVWDFVIWHFRTAKQWWGEYEWSLPLLYKVGDCAPQRKFEKWTQKKSSPAIGDYRYHELGPLISYFPCHWVVPVDFPNTCPMKIERILYRIIARYGRDIYTLTQSYYSLKSVTLRKLPCEKKYVFFIFITQ